jgi:protein-S-isoprenylcysteine O-methyltransferase Ste14
VLAGDFYHVGDTTAGDIDLGDGWDRVPRSGQYIGWLGLEGNEFEFGHTCRFSAPFVPLSPGLHVFFGAGDSTDPKVSMKDLTAIYGDKSPSMKSKATLVCVHLLIVLAAAWLLFGGGIAKVDMLLGRQPQLASALRRGMLMGAAGLYFLRTVATIFIFLKRRMGWSEVGLIALWIMTIDMAFVYVGGRNEASFGNMGVIGVVLLLAGSAVNTVSEWQRHQWKQRPENAGRLYTGGLFRYARHINYFGDQVLFTGWMLITGHVALLVIPVIMAFGFLFGNIPALDRYLEKRYGDDYRNYARVTKRFIPYVY